MNLFFHRPKNRECNAHPPSFQKPCNPVITQDYKAFLKYCQRQEANVYLYIYLFPLSYGSPTALGPILLEEDTVNTISVITYGRHL